MTTETNLPQLTGSEKQVAWAVDIRAQFIAMINDRIAGFDKRDPSKQKADFAAKVASIKTAYAEMKTESSAKFWIDNRAALDIELRARSEKLFNA